MPSCSDSYRCNGAVNVLPLAPPAKSGLREWITSTHFLPIEVSSVLAIALWLTGGASLMWAALLIGVGACVTCLLLQLQPLGAIDTDGGLYHVGMRRVRVRVQPASGAAVEEQLVPTRVEVVGMYPTYMPPMEYQSWIPQKDRRWIGVLSAALGIRKFFLRDIPLVRVKVTQNAEVLNLRAPIVTEVMRIASLGGVDVSSPVSTLQVKPRTIIVFSPSFLMHAHAYAGLCLQLAARGAIVLIVQHDEDKIEELFNEQNHSALPASVSPQSLSPPTKEVDDDGLQLNGIRVVEMGESGSDEDDDSHDSKKQRGHSLKRRLRMTFTKLRSLGRSKPAFTSSSSSSFPAPNESSAQLAASESAEEELERLERRVEEIMSVVAAVASGDILRRLFVSQSDIDAYLAAKPCVHLMGHGLGGTSVLRAAQRIQQESKASAGQTLPRIGSVVSFDAWPRPLETLQEQQLTSKKASAPSPPPSSSSSTSSSSAFFSQSESSPTTFLLLDSEEWVEHHGTTRVLKHIHCDGVSQYAERPVVRLSGAFFHDRYTGTNHWSISDIGRLCGAGIPSAAIKVLGIHPKLILRTTKKGKVQRRALLDTVAQRVISIANSK